MAEEQRLSFPFEARYFQQGELDANTKQLWFVLHGQGHLAQYFIKKFEVINTQGICVIAPEGLSRYYLDGFYGRVGATWMTKENRSTDIKNYITYLNAIYQQLDISNSDIKITLLGFSQGAATVCRWAMNTKIDFDRLILWAGIFPFDMDFEKGRELLKNKTVISVNGDQDEFVNEKKIEELRSYEEKLGFETQKINFNGGHEILPETLKLLV